MHEEGTPLRFRLKSARLSTTRNSQRTLDIRTRIPSKKSICSLARFPATFDDVHCSKSVHPQLTGIAKANELKA